MPTDGPIDKILHALRERAKELHCLYAVHELVNRPDATVDDVCWRLLEVIPPGWQYPDACWARITLEGATYELPGGTVTPWVQKADIVVPDEPVGHIEVFYTRPTPRADEGPFLKEERKLIDTIAERIAHFVAQRRLQSTLHHWEAATDRAASRPRERGEWWVIVEFLRKTDQPLLTRIVRRMINHLCWNGVDEAQALLQRVSATPPGSEDGAIEDNRPLERGNVEPLLAVTEAVFQIAADRLSEREIVSCIERWIRDDKSGFLVETVENQCTSLGDVTDALGRYQQVAARDGELSRPIQLGLRVSLVRRFLTEDLGYINTAKHYIEVGDFHDLAQRIISPPSSHGRLGGKTAGLLLAWQIVWKSKEFADALGGIKVPKSWYLTSDTILSFIEHNHLEDLYSRKYLEIGQIRREYPHIVQVFKHSQFPPEIIKGLSLALDDLADRPIIVRSSSLLEDRMGAAFSGKYKSLFLANRGTKAERLAALMDAIAEVYASVFGPDPIEYRAERGLLDLHEEMGIIVQEVVGSRVGPYVLPAYAGVAFSHNEFRWSARIRREDGLIRLVPGLGTRAVDRMADDYPVLVAPGQPGLQVNVTADEVIRYSPKHVDAINLDTGRFETVAIADLLRSHGREFPVVAQILSILEDGSHRPAGFDWDPQRDRTIVTFEGLIANTPFIPQMRALLQVLREKLGGPVDIEFASDGTDFYLLQCRPQSFADDDAAAPIPRDVPIDRVVFTANRHVSNGRVSDITHIVYVDPERYSALGGVEDLREVGRAIGRLNKLLPKRQFILMGPGRWGSRGDIRLGVSVTYSDLSNTAMLVEIAAPRGGSVPEVSFGTHFFQDLVEAAIRYLPLFPSDPEVVFNDRFLRSAPNILRDALPEYGYLADTLRVIDVARATGGLILRVLMNADLDQALGLLATPASVAEPAPGRRRAPEPPLDDHWRWRLRMAECVAAQADPVRFGVRGMYVFGSTKNATAGPGSDIDLIVHVDAFPEKRRELELWLEGWSRCLAETNYVRTGYKSKGLLDVHYVTDEDIAKRTSYAAKIGAITDAARPLTLGTAAS